jgi:hypothetical protein
MNRLIIIGTKNKRGDTIQRRANALHIAIGFVFQEWVYISCLQAADEPHPHLLVDNKLY